MTDSHAPSRPVAPARLALSLHRSDSSGLIDVANLRAEPLPLSLVSAGLTGTPPPARPPAPRRLLGPWVVGSAFGLTLALVGMVAALRPSPVVVVEHSVPVDPQLAMQEAESTAVTGTAEHQAPARAKARARTPAAAEAEPAQDAPPTEATPEAQTTPETPSEPSSAAAEPPEPRASGRRTKRASTRSSTRASAETTRPAEPAPASKPASIPVECVLDPTRCTSRGRGPSEPDASPAPAPDALPAKLSIPQLKQALATTKADARRCGPEHGVDPGTAVKVKLSIEGRTGTVVSSSALAPHAGTSLGDCVAKALGRTQFSRFSAARMGTIYTVRL